MALNQAIAIIYGFISEVNIATGLATLLHDLGS
jgi:hypothetical protein